MRHADRSKKAAPDPYSQNPQSVTPRACMDAVPGKDWHKPKIVRGDAMTGKTIVEKMMRGSVVGATRFSGRRAIDKEPDFVMAL